MVVMENCKWMLEREMASGGDASRGNAAGLLFPDKRLGGCAVCGGGGGERKRTNYTREKETKSVGEQQL